MTSRRPTILHIFSGDLWAGAEVAIFNLLAQLHAGGELNLIALALNEGTLTERLRALGIETHVIRESGASFAGLSLAAWRLLRRTPVDVIHSHRYKENLLACLLAKTLKAKSLVSTVHGLSEPPVRASRAAGRLSATTRLDYLLLRRRFNRIVAVSAEMRGVLVRRHGLPEARVSLIHNGIPLPAAVPPASPASGILHIGSVGRLDPVKRFDLLLAVAAHIRAETRAVRFSILGDGPLRTELQRQAQAWKLDGDVEFAPACPDPLSYYRSLDIYLNTSLHEGLPLSVLEAMACGKPAVAPSVGGIPEIITHGVNGLLVESSEPKGFASACMRLVADASLRLAMGRNARRSVADRFRDTTMAEAYQRLYLELSGRPAAVGTGQLRTSEGVS